MRDRVRNVKRPSNRTAISIFSGAGGMDLGFRNAGFDVRLAIEIDPSCCDTLRRNMPETVVVQADINELTAPEICGLAGVRRGEVDCVFGGPPCQSFSLAGRREGLDDERGKLVLRFIELVRAIRPKSFVLENVKGMVNWQDGVVIREIERLLEDPLEDGEYFSASHKVLNAADFGVPQNRERVFIVGTRTKKLFRFPKPTHGHGLKQYSTVGDALGNLPAADAPSDMALRVSQTIKGRIARHGY